MVDRTLKSNYYYYYCRWHKFVQMQWARFIPKISRNCPRLGSKLLLLRNSAHAQSAKVSTHQAGLRASITPAVPIFTHGCALSFMRQICFFSSPTLDWSWSALLIQVLHFKAMPHSKVTSEQPKVFVFCYCKIASSKCQHFPLFCTCDTVCMCVDKYSL